MSKQYEKWVSLVSELTVLDKYNALSTDEKYSEIVKLIPKSWPGYLRVPAIKVALDACTLP